MITVHLTCTHPPHQCRCRHNQQTQVNREDLTNNLIKHNPALLKYLGKRQTLDIQPQTKVEQKNNLNVVTQSINPNQPYRSIVEEKGLQFCLDYPQQSKKSPKKEQSIQQIRQLSPKKDINDIQQPNMNPPSPIKQKGKQKKDGGSRQGQIQTFHKDLRQQSRYLSDTAFRKYFNRQCFQNYGRNNISNKADGFVYGNYMKTHNINPHTGQNIPINQQTFYHALVSGSPQKYQGYTQELNLGMTGKMQSNKQIQKQRKELSKSRLNVEKMLKDNEKHNKVEKKYEHLHLKQKSNKVKSTQLVQNSKSEKYFKAPGYLQINTKKHFHPEQNQKVNNKPVNQKKQQSQVDQLKPNTKSIFVSSQQIPSNNPQPKSPPHVSFDPVVQVQSNNNHSRKISSPKSIACDHTQNQETVECPGCLNKMKKMILQLSQKDPDLAERIMASAQKEVRYKNYGLNNYQNAAKNPHNYRAVDGKLNIYNA